MHDSSRFRKHEIAAILYIGGWFGLMLGWARLLNVSAWFAFGYLVLIAVMLWSAVPFARWMKRLEG